MQNSNFNLDSLLSGTGIASNHDAIGNLLEKFGLNWTVSKELLSLSDGTPTGFYGIVRDDTRHTFATAKDGYEPYQNSELAELVNEAAGTLGLSIDRGGMFHKGAKIYLQLETGLLKNLGKNHDTVKKYITGINSHDGSKALSWGMSNITISCQNTFNAAAKEISNRVRHTATMRAKVDEMVRQIEVVQKAEKTLYETFFKLADAPARKIHIDAAIKTALDIDLGGTKSDLTSYQLNRLKDMSSAIAGEMNQKGETLWGLFSGVTKYTTHMMPGGSENREQSKAMGKGYEVDNKIFQSFADMVMA